MARGARTTEQGVARPPNARRLYITNMTAIIRRDPNNKIPLNKIDAHVCAMWMNESNEVREYYSNAYFVSQVQHQMLHPNYHIHQRVRLSREDQSKRQERINEIKSSTNASLLMQVSCGVDCDLGMKRLQTVQPESNTDVSCATIDIARTQSAPEIMQMKPFAAYAPFWTSSYFQTQFSPFRTPHGSPAMLFDTSPEALDIIPSNNGDPILYSELEAAFGMPKQQPDLANYLTSEMALIADFWTMDVLND